MALTSGFTDGAEQIWLNNVECSGNEARLVDCDSDPLGSDSCGHHDDAGVLCSDAGCSYNCSQILQ